MCVEAEINGRFAHYGSLKAHGDTLVTGRHYASDDIERMLAELATVWQHLNETWEDRKQLLTQCYDLQVGTVITGGSLADELLQCSTVWWMYSV